VRVALAYDSNPSAGYTSDPLEGDLDIHLLDASSTVVASSAGIDSWEIIDYQVPTEGDYTVRIRNFGGSLSGSEWTYAGLAVWPGHYVLQAYSPQVRDKPPGAWNPDSGDDFRFTRGSYWNAAGLRSPVSADYDVYLFNNSVYADPADHALLQGSLSTSAVDFVLIDGNHAPSGSYYATVSAYAGTGDYSLEHASSTTDLGSGTYGPYIMTANSVVRIWDIYFAQNQRRTVSVRPITGAADLGVSLFDSDSASPTSWYQGRGQAIATADANGAGLGETLVYMNTGSADWMGLVVYNKSSAAITFYLNVDLKVFLPIVVKN
jgi:hypothetical protein